jgi:glycosyltransferase involved in cell wall biosynthesis
MTAKVDISVVVLSYDRVNLLERTLRACVDPRTAPGVAYEIIVVDNHPDRLAEALVAAIAEETGAPLAYLADARRNISIVRNLGIKAARGRYVAFIDDDEAPDPNWLSALFHCLERTGADAAFGPNYICSAVCAARVRVWAAATPPSGSPPASTPPSPSPSPSGTAMARTPTCCSASPSPVAASSGARPPWCGNSWK